MAIYWRQVLLWDCITSLTKGNVRFLVGPPRNPLWKPRPIRISGLGKVSPIALHGLREPVVRRSKWQPTEGARLKRAEDVRDLQRMEGTELRLPLSWDRTVEPVNESASSSAHRQGSFCSDGACRNDVVARLVE